MKKKYKIFLILIVVLLLSGLFISFSYAKWFISIKQNDSDVIASGCISLEIIEEKNDINLINAIPMSDEEGSTTIPYSIRIQNTCSITVLYNISLDILSDTNLDLNHVKVKTDYLEPVLLSSLNHGDIVNENSTDNIILKDEMLLPANINRIHRIYLWLDKDTTLEEANKKLLSKVRITGVPFNTYNYNILKNDILADSTIAKINNDSNISSITFNSTLDIPDNAVESWDVSLNKNNKIMAYLVNDNKTIDYDHDGIDDDTYDLFIASNETIYLHDAFRLFYHNYYVETVNNLDILNTKYLMNASAMFDGCGISSSTFNLDISSMDTSNVYDMSTIFWCLGYANPNFTFDISNLNTYYVYNFTAMFSGIGNSNTNFTLDVSKLNTSNGLYFSSMFNTAGYNSTVIDLDLSNFDTSYALDLSDMFDAYGKENTTLNLDISNFDTSKISNVKNMFKDIAANNPTFTLTLGPKFKIDNFENYENVFLNLKSTNTIYVPNEEVQSWIINDCGNSELTSSNVIIKRYNYK